MYLCSLRVAVWPWRSTEDNEEFTAISRKKHQASLVAQLICLQCWRLQFDSWVGKMPWRRDRLPTPVFLGFPCGPASKESACNVGDLGLIPGLGRSSGEGKGYPLQYSGLENPMDCIVLGVAKSGTRLSGFHFPGKRNQRYALFSLEIMPNHLLPNMALKIKKITIVICRFYDLILTVDWYWYL